MALTSMFGLRCFIHRLSMALLLTVMASHAASGAEDRKIHLLATGSAKGPYHKAGVALSTLVKLHLLPSTGIDLNLIDTTGPSANVRALEADETQFALVEGLVGHFAQAGIGPFAEDGPQENLRAVTALWPNVEHVIIRGSSVASGTIEDFLALEGQKMSFGRHDTATIASNWTLMANLGVNIETYYDLTFLGHQESAEAVVQGAISGTSIPGRLPSNPVAKALAGPDGSARLLEFTDEQVRRADGGLGVWRRFTVPAGTYPGQQAPLGTIAQSNFLAVRADVPEEIVYRLTQAIFDHVDRLRSMDITLRSVTIEQALDGLPVPLHPGAMRYFQEIGRLASPEKKKPSKDDALLRRAPL